MAKRTNASGDGEALSSTLLIISCSQRKLHLEGPPEGGPSLLTHLPPDLACRLGKARAAVRAKAQIDERTRMPALQRYDGELYRVARGGLIPAVRGGLHVLILSGGYGVLLGDEPIGCYDAQFRPGWWPEGLLADILVEYAASKCVSRVRAVTARTRPYRTVIEQTRCRWSRAGVSDAWLHVPHVTGGGAMKKSPHAQGEAIGALLRGELTSPWQSPDGTQVCAIPLCKPQ